MWSEPLRLGSTQVEWKEPSVWPGAKSCQRSQVRQGEVGGGALLTPTPNCSMHGSSRGGCKQVGASIFSTSFASRTPTIHTTGEGEKTRPTMTFLITCSIHRVPLPRGIRPLAYTRQAIPRLGIILRAHNG